MKIVNSLTTAITYFVTAADWQHRRDVVTKALKANFERDTGDEADEIQVEETRTRGHNRVRVTLRKFHFSFEEFTERTIAPGLEYNKEIKND